MKYQLRHDQFCALANDSQWQVWLNTVAPDLSSKLKSHLKTTRSCKSNREVMQIIKNDLDRRGLSENLLSFLKRVFPVALKVVNESNGSANKPVVQNKIDNNLLNKHDVFKSYRPHLLSFPHKRILVDQNPESLIQKVRQFIKTKIHTDYIIVEDRAYVEYFEPKFRKEAEELSNQKREVFLYKKKNKI